MLSVRPRELRLVIQHHEAAMMTITCSSLVYRLSFAVCIGRNNMDSTLKKRKIFIAMFIQCYI